MRAFAAIALALFFAGCAAPNAPDLGAIPVVVPEWMKNPDSNNSIGAASKARVGAIGVKAQQLDAETKARKSLQDRVSAIAFDAATEVLSALAPDLNASEIRKDALEAAALCGSFAATKFERTAFAWSPRLDYYALFRISYDRLQTEIVSAISAFVGASEPYSANFDMLRDLIGGAVDRAIAAAKGHS